MEGCKGDDHFHDRQIRIRVSVGVGKAVLHMQSLQRIDGEDPPPPSMGLAIRAGQEVRGTVAGRETVLEERRVRPIDFAGAISTITFGFVVLRF